jgi:hypothetical protein
MVGPDDVFTDVDLAIGTYRHAVGTTIPDLTRVAWREKHDEIVARTPDVSEKSFVYLLTRQEYEHDYGIKYRKPSFLARTIGLRAEFIRSRGSVGWRLRRRLGGLRLGRAPASFGLWIGRERDGFSRA